MRGVPVVPANVRPGVVLFSGEVVLVCGVQPSQLAGKSSGCVLSQLSRTTLDWALSWSTVAARTEEVLETEPDLMLSVRESVSKLSLVTSSAADWSPFVTALLLPLIVVMLLWLLLLLLLL